MVPRSLFAGGSLAPVLVEFVYGKRNAHAVRPGARRHAAELERIEADRELVRLQVKLEQAWRP
jgi:hypothetical protein